MCAIRAMSRFRESLSTLIAGSRALVRVCVCACACVCARACVCVVCLTCMLDRLDSAGLVSSDEAFPGRGCARAAFGE
jgi:hypothetical protein